MASRRGVCQDTGGGGGGGPFLNSHTTTPTSSAAARTIKTSCRLMLAPERQKQTFDQTTHLDVDARQLHGVVHNRGASSNQIQRSARYGNCRRKVTQYGQSRLRDRAGVHFSPAGRRTGHSQARAKGDSQGVATKRRNDLVQHPCL